MRALNCDAATRSVVLLPTGEVEAVKTAVLRKAEAGGGFARRKTGIIHEACTCSAIQVSSGLVEQRIYEEEHSNASGKSRPRPEQSRPPMRSLNVLTSFGRLRASPSTGIRKPGPGNQYLKRRSLRPARAALRSQAMLVNCVAREWRFQDLTRGGAHDMRYQIPAGFGRAVPARGRWVRHLSDLETVERAGARDRRRGFPRHLAVVAVCLVTL